MNPSVQPGQRRVGRFHVLTDFHFQQRYSHAALAELAIRGGADTIQFRQKRGFDRHVLLSARRTAAVCRDMGVPLLVDDRIDLAQAVGAEGVHVGQEDLPVGIVRRILGSDAIVGATATNVDQAIEAEEQGASYIGFGPVFRTRSKDNPASTKGLYGLREACDAVRIPVIAISGITPERVEGVMSAGAWGFAVMTGVSTADDPAAAARTYRTALSATLKAVAP
ncbi:MAG: thiamine phosphate synthase [Rhodothermales bacterium]|nr:thiamine phosphate synthase [Rhodothermales bacterium]